MVKGRQEAKEDEIVLEFIGDLKWQEERNTDSPRSEELHWQKQGEPSFMATQAREQEKLT